MFVGIGVGIGRQRFGSGIFSAYAARVVADGGVTEAGSCVDAVSTLLKTASLLLVPSGYKSGKVYSQIPTNGNGDLTWTRGSDAVRTNSTGLLESMTTGVPRLSYMYGSCPALLLEPQRTNLVLYSEQFDNASWFKLNGTISANSTTAPDGNNNADKLIENTLNASHSILQNLTLNTSTSYNISVYLKASERFRFRVRFTVFNGTNEAFINLNTASTTSGNLINAGNGWYRFDWTINSNTGAGIPSVAVTLVDSFGNDTYTGDGVSGAFIWGAQIEVGAYPTTYIPTTTATVTRIADSFSRSNIFTNGLITSSGGTWFLELRNNVAYARDGATSGFFIGDSSPSLTNGLAIRNIGGGSFRLGIQKFIATVNTQLYATTTDTVKIAIKWNGITADVFVNGTKVVSATTFTTTNMELLNCFTTDVPKFIQQMALYSSPLSDTDCTTLTTL